MAKKSRSFVDHSGNAISLFESINRKSQSIPERKITLKEQIQKEQERQKTIDLNKPEIEKEEARYIQISPNFRK